MNEIIDLSHNERNGNILEGTGSIVFDHVTRTGSTLFAWPKIKPLLRAKMERVIEEFYTHSPVDDLPAVPNVDQFSFPACREKVFQQLDCFAGIPFTVQRLCELLTAPRKHYKRTDKFMRALEKNMLIVSCVEPRVARPAPPPPTAMGPPSAVLLNGDHASSSSSNKRSEDGEEREGGEPEKRRRIDSGDNSGDGQRRPLPDVGSNAREKPPSIVAKSGRARGL